MPIEVPSSLRSAFRSARRRLRAPAPPDPAAPVVLVYHRIADTHVDPWEISVSPALFREQLKAVRQHRQPISMDRLVASLAEGRVPPYATAITFDDGYEDNANLAKPMLEELGVPATMFLTTGAIGGECFWWDELAALVFLTPDPVQLDFTRAGHRFVHAWSQLAEGPEGQGRADAGDRANAYLAIWEVLRQLRLEDRMAVMEELRQRIAAPPAGWQQTVGRPMDEQEARGLRSASIAVGSHALHHVDLTTLAEDARWKEIHLSRQSIVELTGEEPTGFAYPHGLHDRATRHMVRKAGYSWAVSNCDAPRIRKGGEFAIRRISAGNWNAARLLGQLGHQSR